MRILKTLSCNNFRGGNLRASFLVAFGLLLVCFTDLGQGACDCETDCSCSESNCTAGQYWLSGAGCVQCPAGHFCLGNETAPQPCPLGTENSSPGAINSSSCTPCAAGYNSTAGSISCTPCPAGYDCTTSPGNATVCAAGSYSNYGEGICRPCPSGKVCLDPSQQPQYCPGGYEPDGLQTKCNPCEAGEFSYNGTSCQACASGSYSLGGQQECTICPAGHQCSNQTISPVRCNPGEYAPAGQANCSQCGKGFHCPDEPLDLPQPCRNGTYTDSVGQTECKLCTAGNFCPFASQGELPCENGTYSKNGSSVCTECPGGYSCADPSADPVQCLNGTYAPSGSQSCLPCPQGAECVTPGLSVYVPCFNGTYLYTDASNQTSCKSCPPGQRCPDPNQAPENCPDGQYSKGGTVACTECPVGHACPVKSADPVPCGNGTFARAGSMYCHPCPVGSQCPSAKLAHHQLCANGSFSIVENSTSCSQCPAGSKCPNPTVEPVECENGSYSKAGATHCTICPGGHSCAIKSANPVPCTPGSFAPSGSLECQECPLGSHCPSNVSSTHTPCAPGSYTNMTSSTECLPCPAGYVCQNPAQSPVSCENGTFSFGSAANCSVCPPGFSCEDKANPVECLAGTYAAAGSIKCQSCPKGAFCPTNGLSTYVLCANGTYSSSKGRSNCTLCDTGFKCPSVGMEAPEECANGTYSNATGARYCVLCPEGHSCENKANSPVQCLAGTYAATGSIKCQSCPKGAYCPSNGLSTYVLCANGTYSDIEGQSDCKQCEPGNRCPSVGLEAPEMCPNGTYSNSNGSRDCILCPEGHSCEIKANSPVECLAGSYAAAGSIKCQSCPKGAYCPRNGLPTYVLCANGTYSSSKGRSNCTSCDTGFKCPSVGMEAPEECANGTYSNATGARYCVLCPEGHSCESKANSPVPCLAGTYSAAGIITCQPCPKGAHCPTSGLPRFVLCANGSYSDTEGRSDCKPCDPGHRCPRVGMKAPEVCPNGTYSNTTGALECILCPEGFSCLGNIFQECLAGTYSGEGSTICRSCPKGAYCPTNGLSTYTLCANGTYADVERLSVCIPCDAGFKCPSVGLQAPEECANGTYSNTTGGRYCILCPEGHRCPVKSDAPVPCDTGFYASEGRVSCTVCPVGFYCPLLTTASPQACPTGFYANESQSASCTECDRGHRCPDATKSPEECSAGYFSSEKGQISCTQCAPGYYTELTAQSSCKTCPAGSRCPLRDSLPEACLDGQYSPEASTECLTCPAGKICSDPTVTPVTCAVGTYSNGSHCIPCDIGHYCPSPLTAPRLCPQGTYANETGSVSCKACDAGYSCLNPASTPEPCAAGEYSIAGQSTCTKCPDGRFSLGAASSCNICPAGRSCINGSVPIPPTECDPGTYSPPGVGICHACPLGTHASKGSSFCSPCPAGHSCNDPSQSPVACTSSQYWNNGGEIPRCVPCPAGYSCGNNTQPPVPCPAGYFSLQGDASCTECEAGQACNDPAQAPKHCSIGTYSQKGATSCKHCPAGYSCPSPSSSISPCVSGSFSVRGQANCTECPIGYMCPSPKQSALRCPLGTTTFGEAGKKACSDCPAGFKCLNPESNATACLNGSYSVGKSVRCLPCPAGHKCPTTDVYPIPCDPGQYSLAHSLVCTDCPAGMECPSTVLMPTRQCEPGTYSVGKAQYCTVCPPGKFCPSTNVSTETDCAFGTFSWGKQERCIPCPSGWQCPSSDGTGNVKCPPGTYSVGSQITCTTCPAGQACPNTHSNQTVTCSPGQYSVRSQTYCTVCPPGYRCPSTTSSQEIECADGTYSKGGQQNCTECPAGYACPSKTDDFQVQCSAGYYTLGKSQACTPCPAGSFCPNITAEPIDCPDGFYSLGFATSCTECPAGHYCGVVRKDSVPLPCPAGQYSNKSATACSACSPGYACKGSDTSPTPPSGLCSLGFYCEDGLREAACPSGTYGNITGAASQAEGCPACPAGYYCPAATRGYPTYRLKCPPGHFCEEGTRTQFEHPCPAGTFNKEIGLERQDQCLDCLPGYYCPAGDQYGDRLCPAGHYCPDKTTGPNVHPCDAGTYTEEQGAQSRLDCKDCPPGYYCEQGTQEPVPCPRGTFNSLIRRESLADCRSCISGMACPRSGLTWPPVKCDAGYYCPAGSSLPNETIHACPPGTFTDRHDLTHARECTSCPERQSCEAGTGGRQKPPQECAKGHYCPLETQSPTQYPCVAGSWTNLTNLKSQEECYECPKGWFCLRGSTSPTALCFRGHYCPPGTKRGTEFPCPAGTYNNRTGLQRVEDCVPCTTGHYCPQGTTNPIQCPRGTFNDVLGAKNQLDGCKQCVAGYFCPNLANYELIACEVANYSGPGASQCTTCEAGHYCDSRTTSKSVMINTKICPAGTHCPPGTPQKPDLVTHACPKGHYCLRGDENAYPIKCPNGTFGPHTGSKIVSECIKCTEGFYCEPEGLEKEADVCPPGYYCPEGTGYRFSHPCPVGYYRKLSAAVSVQDCSVCFSGHFCDDRGLANPKTCPNGFFCPTGTTIPQPCPSGYYGNSSGVKRSEECTPCPAGQYCAGYGLTEPSGPCDAGFYCSGRAYTSAPPEGSPTGGLCPQGGYCPQGAKTPEPCPVGHYSGTKGNKEPDDCITCDPGFYCAGDTNPEPTGPCSPGHYCTGGASTPTQHVTPKGHFSSSAASSPVQCPVGTYQETDRAEQCTNCTEKNFCDEMGLEFPKTCISGHYCPPNSIKPTACPPGTYNPNGGTATIQSCLPCDSGYFCKQPGLNATEGECFAGYYCLEFSPSPTPSNGSLFTNITYGGICPAGYYCQIGTQRPYQYPCPNGTYSNRTGLEREDQCISCDPGRSCTGEGLTGPNGVCQAGHFCVRGAKTPQPLDGVTGNICPTGYHCPTGSATFKQCVPGTYSNVTGLEACLTCPARFYCEGHEGDSKTPIPCPRGHYCPEGTDKSIPKCPPGTHNPQLSLARQDECQPCPPGKYCQGSGVESFPSSESGNCDPGFFCRSGVNTPRPSQNFSGFGGVCPPGAYCPEGTSEPKGCPSGRFSNVSQLESASQCTLCSDGHYCEQSNLTEPTGKCAPRFYCRRGSDTATPSNVSAIGGPCPKGHFCELGTAFPLGCRRGTYNPNEGEEACFTCPAGYYCPENSTSYTPYPCPKGYYCPNGTEYATQYPCSKGYFNGFEMGMSVENCTPCPGGKFCNDSGLVEPSGPCAPGYFCVNAAWSERPQDYDNFTSGDCLCPANSTGGECQEGFFCPNGSHEPIACTGGYYCEGKGKDAVTAQCDPGWFCTSRAKVPRPSGGITGNICPQGRYCPKGTKVPRLCPTGTFSNNTGLSHEGNCTNCTPGSYCETEGLTKPTGLCSAKFFCPTGERSDERKPCTVGHFCPEGIPAPVKCPSGTYQDEAQQDSCKECPAGYYCDNKDDLSNFISYLCPNGYYCPNGTRYATEFGCPNGTHGNGTQLFHPDQCIKCPPGKFCYGSSPTFTGDCQEGYYCRLGSHTPTPVDGFTGEECPVGHYCVRGTVAPESCPPGTFSNTLGLRNIHECTNCTAGQFCNGSALTAPSGDCWPRYYCHGRAAHPAPQDGVTGGNCTPGHYCPGRTPEPIPCEDGTYMKDPLADACLDCPAGFFCVNDKSQDPEPCPQGFYCPVNTGFDWKFCPKGTYGDRPGLSNATSCRPCDSGKFCAHENATTVTGNCNAGYFCRRGAKSATPSASADSGPCPEGHYCPAGTGEPKECPKGTYSDVQFLENEYQCQNCTEGNYCGELGLRSVSGPCDAGFYCLKGSKVPNPPNVTESGGPCPVGHYCPRGTSYPLGCEAGTYNDRTGQSNCTACCAGYYCPSNSTACVLECPLGHYCPSGTESRFDNSCPKGYFNNETRRQSMSDCTPCLPGKFCDKAGLEKPTGDCAGGWYCIRGAWSAKPADVGVLGYCNSTNGTGCFCPNTTTGGVCQPGFYCPNGSREPQPCLRGHYCSVAELSNVTGPCDAGYFCKEGARFANPTDNNTGGICPRGHYCPVETYDPKKCPEGTYSNSTSNQNVSSCQPCLPGHYCGSRGLEMPSGECDAGFYCPGGQKTSSPVAYTCTPGHKCPMGSAYEVPCDNGTYQDEFQQGTCKTCLEGYYCDGTILNVTHCSHGVQFPTPCIKGHFCLSGTRFARQHKCPAGTFNNRTHGKSVADCTNCPAGKYCAGEGNEIWTNDCTRGFHCISRADNPSPNDGVTGVVCPTGHYCPSGTTVTIPCQKGTYGPTEQLGSQAECKGCEPGEYCAIDGLNQTSGNCSAGYFCKQNASVNEPTDGVTGDVCWIGHFCPEGTASPRPCSPGYYMNHTQGAVCYTCPPGHYCVNRVSPEPCPAGWYCPLSTGHDWQPCPRGTYSPVEFLSREEQCKPCEPGDYCPFLNATSTAGECDEGFFCHNGSDQQQPSGGNRGDAGICPTGRFCPRGDPRAPIACPAGHFNNRTHGSSSADCEKCPGGQYCEGAGLTWPSGPCDAGYYCVVGSTSRKPNVSVTGGPCPPGHFCPVESPYPIACKGGEYNSRWTQSECLVCPPGYFCPNASTNVTDCPKGFYCPNGSASAIPCPKGSFKNVTLGDKVGDCTICPAGEYCEFSGLPEPSGLCAGGWYCTGGSWQRMPLNSSDIANGTSVCPLIGEIGGFCKKGNFCPSGSHEPVPCTPGYYCERDKLDKESGECAAGYYCNGSTIYSHPVNQTTGDRCPKGHYCPTKSSYPTPCLPGTYADTEYNQFKNNCKPCIPGTFCPTYGLDFPAGNCSEGFYCLAGETQQSPPDKECQPGHYCPEGSGLHNPCPAGTYQPYSRKGFCYICPAGSYCDPNEARQNMSCEGNGSCGVIAPSDCPAGYFCPNGTKWAKQHPCPVGTFSNVTKRMEEDQCTPCTEGYYCHKSGITAPTDKCHAGYYCVEGSSIPTPNDTLTGAPCPPGSYCVEGSHRPEPCPAGTYGPSQRLQSRSGCVDCDGGKYCNVEGLAAPNGSCDPGFFCEIRAIRSNPVISGQGGGICPTGHYCPSGTTTPFKCPPGTFNNETHATEPSYCVPCTPGDYCEGYGNTNPDGQCDEGWYCKRGAYARRPVPNVSSLFNNSNDFTCPIYSVNFTGGICPTGHFCPQGSSEPKSCLPGTFCGQTGLASPEGNCTAGYYCKGGDTISNPTNCTV